MGTVRPQDGEYPVLRQSRRCHSYCIIVQICSSSTSVALCFNCVAVLQAAVNQGRKDKVQGNKMNTVSSWLQELPDFDRHDPRPGFYEVFRCRTTSKIFPSRTATQVFTDSTGNCNFVKFWIKVINEDGTKWRAEAWKSAAEPAADDLQQERLKIEAYHTRREQAKAR